MDSAYEDPNVAASARNVVDNIKDLRRGCQAVIDNANNNIVFELDRQLKRTQRALQGHIDGPIPFDDLGAAMEAQYKRITWTTEKVKITNLQTVLIPAFISAISDNLSMLTDGFALDPTHGGLLPTPLTGGVRTALVTLCTEIIDSTDVDGA